MIGNSKGSPAVSLALCAVVNRSLHAGNIALTRVSRLRLGYQTDVLRASCSSQTWQSQLAWHGYHPPTARLYTDFGLMTSTEEICVDANGVFQQLTNVDCACAIAASKAAAAARRILIPA